MVELAVAAIGSHIAGDLGTLALTRMGVIGKKRKAVKTLSPYLLKAAKEGIKHLPNEHRPLAAKEIEEVEKSGAQQSVFRGWFD